ncbi:hypothetical protein [Amycolatopsis magusensis]|uniref:Excreted virulence factor EspC, type VII ESX diderm n=1 Tax=Amycolatopsis magusensis TaxID=882444 RepID=A0ABS4PZ76_9PSEU|nr:hypothetical protein [Amycolatopsis magusensis]MBP2184731.1 hypothetical protein [Amycolatopsis magusensis]
MSGYEVTLEALGKAGDSADSLGEQLARIDLGGALSTLPKGMPGSRTAASAGTLGTTWRTEVATYGREARDHAKKLLNAKKLYETDEEAAKAALRC